MHSIYISFFSDRHEDHHEDHHEEDHHEGLHEGCSHRYHRPTTNHSNRAIGYRMSLASATTMIQE